MPYDCMTEKPVGYREETIDGVLWHFWTYWFYTLNPNIVYNNETTSITLNGIEDYVTNG